MPLSTPAAVLQHAGENRYLVGAFFVFNSDTLGAVLEAARAENSPVFVQVGLATRAYQPNMQLFVDSIKQYAQTLSVPIVLQHDHCPTLEDVETALSYGIRSIMFDGSGLPYAQNIRQTRAAAERVHRHGGWLEAELGRIAGYEEGVLAVTASLTQPEEAADFVRETGCDCLAVSVGTTHGGIQAADLPLDFERLDRIRAALPTGYPLVLHGAASLPQAHMDRVNRHGGRVERLRMVAEENIARTSEYGVCKANMDVDNFLCFTGSLREFLQEHPEIYNPVPLMRVARDAFQADVARKMRDVLRSSGKA